MTTIIRILSLFLLTGILNAQDSRPAGPNADGTPTIDKKFVIMGTIVDAASRSPLEYATVSLFQQADSSLVTGNISGADGIFRIETKPGSYFLKVEFLAYQTRLISDLELSPDQPLIDLGMIELADEAAMLEEVVVQAEKSQMQMSLDKKVFNVGQDLSSRGGNAADLLDNVPSVQVDVEGTVSLRGSSNVRILVDGKPSGLIGVGGSDGLRNLPANLIERVEVITNPSARYEAEGMAGIINIILKKERKTGLNGSFDFTVGQPDNYGAAINLNYRRPAFNLFTNYGFSYRRSPGFFNTYQEVYNGDTTLITDIDGDRDRGGWSQNVRLGADFFFNPKNTLTTALTYRYGKDDNSAEFRYYDYFNTLDNLTGITIRTDEEIETEPKIEYALTYKKTYDRKGQELTADIRFQDNTETEGSDLTNRFFTPEMIPTGEAPLLQRSNNKETERQLIGQLDFVRPIGKEGKFEVGVRSSLRNINNDFLVEEFNDVSWEALDGLSNDFRYEENINAVYLIYGNKVDKFSYQLGLRGEHSLISTKLLTTNEVNDRDYLNLFPSVHLSYELPANNAVQISYSRRVRRPRFWDLNPFFTFSDNRNFFSGNPNLDPEFTDSYEIGHIKYFDKGSISSSIYYRHTTDVIERIRQVKDDGTSVTQPENLATENSYGLEFAGNYNPVKWWKLDASFNFFRSIVEGELNGQNFDADNYAWFTRGTSRFNLPQGIDLQVRFDYRAPQQTVQGTRKSITSVDLAASKDIIKGKGTLTLSVRDVFNSRIRRFTAEGDNFLTIGEMQWRPRMAILTLNYRLNQKKQRGGRRGGDFEGGDDF